ncbi:hypothetical protein PG991_016099 [Apiospora marii]|uniref:O-methyltransferase domain-containing protein n=1 Tax=Apiospora marii TaxID=335849 RepID=A0ABR1R0Q3_9PEZI
MAAEFSLAETPIGKYFASMAEMGVIRVFVEHGLFDAIPSDSDEGISLEALTAKLGVEHNLIERMAAFLLSVGVLTAPAPGRVAHTPASQAFTDPRVAQFYSYLFDFFMGPTTRWPDYFKLNGLAEPATSSRSPGGFALGMPDKTAWVAAYAAEHAAEARDLIVDVAGGKGQALKEILEETPAIPAARCVLQDQPHVIAEAVAEHEGSSVLGPVKKIGSSIFGEQPVRDALVYYIRRVLNDWSDREALQILKNVRAACAPDSRVLVAEYLRPSERPSVYTSTVDMFILNIGGKVRGEKAFGELAAQAGLRIASVARHEKTESAVVEMVPI